MHGGRVLPRDRIVGEFQFHSIVSARKLYHANEFRECKSVG